MAETLVAPVEPHTPNFDTPSIEPTIPTEMQKFEAFCNSVPGFLGNRINQAYARPLRTFMARAVSEPIKAIVKPVTKKESNPHNLLNNLLMKYPGYYTGSPEGFRTESKFTSFRSANNFYKDKAWLAIQEEIEGPMREILAERGAIQGFAGLWQEISHTPLTSAGVAGGAVLTAAVMFTPLGLPFAGIGLTAAGVSKLLSRYDREFRSRSEQNNGSMKLDIPSITDALSRTDDLFEKATSVDPTDIIQTNLYKSKLVNELKVARTLFQSNHAMYVLGGFMIDKLDMAMNIFKSRAVEANITDIRDVGTMVINGEDGSGNKIVGLNGSLLLSRVGDAVSKFTVGYEDKIALASNHSERVGAIANAVNSIDPDNLPEGTLDGLLQGQSWSEIKEYCLNLISNLDILVGGGADFANNYEANMSFVDKKLAEAQDRYETINSYNGCDYNPEHKHSDTLAHITNLTTLLSVLGDSKFFTAFDHSHLSKNQRNDRHKKIDELKAKINDLKLGLAPVSFDIASAHENKLNQLESQITTALASDATGVTGSISAQDHAKIYPALTNSKSLINSVCENYSELFVGADLLLNSPFTFGTSGVTFQELFERVLTITDEADRDIQILNLVNEYSVQTGADYSAEVLRQRVSDIILFKKITTLNSKAETILERVNDNSELNQVRLESMLNTYQSDLNNYSGDGFMVNVGSISNLNEHVRLLKVDADSISSSDENAFTPELKNRLNKLYEDSLLLNQHANIFNSRIDVNIPQTSDISVNCHTFGEAILHVSSYYFNPSPSPQEKATLQLILGTGKLFDRDNNPFDRDSVSSDVLKTLFKNLLKPTPGTIKGLQETYPNFVQSLIKALKDSQLQTSSDNPDDKLNVIDSVRLGYEVDHECAKLEYSSGDLYNHILHEFGSDHIRTNQYQRHQGVFNLYMNEWKENALLIEKIVENRDIVIQELQETFTDYGANIEDVFEISDQLITNKVNPMVDFGDGKFAGLVQEAFAKALMNIFELS